MPRANVKDKRKAQLIAATLDSIAKRGLQETTITHISKGAGMSRGIINFYFTSKEAMLLDTLRTLVEEYDAHWQEAIAPEKNLKGQARLVALASAHFSKKLCQAKRLNIMSAFWGHAATHSAYRDVLRKSDTALELALSESWKQAGVTEQEAPQVARQNHALIRGLWLAFMLCPQDSDREGLLAECSAFIEQRLGAQKISGNNAAKRRILDSNAPTHFSSNVTSLTAAKSVAKRPQKASGLEGQMDIEDLFAGLK